MEPRRVALESSGTSPMVQQLLLEEMAHIMSNAPHPNYSCPTCRVVVRQRPLENFAMKALVQSIADLQDESVPDHIVQTTIEPFWKFFPHILG